MEERLQKILARAGVASRRAAENYIRQGRVTVNGRLVSELGSKADPERDDIRVDGERLRLKVEKLYLLLNKPRGYVTTLSDPQGRPTVADLLRGLPRLFPVGRLDYDTEGLLVLTNDGEFAQLLGHPRFGVPRTYRATVKGVPSPARLARLERGVKIDAGRSVKAQGVRLIKAEEDRATLELSISEGRHHQVKRMFMAIGHPVRRLRRVALGPVSLGDLRPGALRPLSPGEVEQLRTVALHEGGEKAS
jgi:23S rRNA pseudouridine2605 synthase